MEEKKELKRYRISRKIMILIVLIASTIMMAITGSWTAMGLSNGMTWREALIETPRYEESRAVGTYLMDESCMILESAMDGHVHPQQPVSGVSFQRIFPTEQTNVLLYMKNIDTGVVYTTVKEWGHLSVEQVEKNYLSSNYSERGTKSCYYLNNGEEGSFLAQMNPDAFAIIVDNVDSIAYYTLAMLAAQETAGAEAASAGTSVDGEEDFADEDQYIVDEEDSYEEMWQDSYPEQWDLFVGLNTSYPVTGSVAYARNVFYQYYRANTWGNGWNALFLVFAAIVAWMLVLIGRQAGHNAQDDGIHTNVMDRFPLELWMLSDVFLLLIGAALCVHGLNDLRYTRGGYAYEGSYYHFISVMLIIGVLILVLTIAKMLNLYLRRIKAKQLCSSILLPVGRVLARGGAKLKKGISDIYLSRKEYQKLILRFVLVAVVNILLTALIAAFVANYAPGLALFVFVILVMADLYLLYRLLKTTKGRDEIRTALRAISAGDIDYQIDTSEMTMENRMMAEEVNRVRDGLKVAVDTQLKSERLKTDLIANVSHDIKTPLTSIINYVDILKREHIKDEKISGYIDILDRKSARLKQLTDDLIEVSKISSGNVTLHMQDINLKQLIKQINGEYEEKFEGRDLQLICNLPEENMMVSADGSRMCRVMENLYNNAAKYAMPGSRVYINGELKDDRVIFSVKNMSEYPLNISADELMERFVRGDSARTTEGSGLGLEIARNLTLMQEGTFDLYLDGDLFKVTLTFPRNPSISDKDGN